MSDSLPCIALTPGSCPQDGKERESAEPSDPPQTPWRMDLSLGTASDSRMDGLGVQTGATFSGRFGDGFLRGTDFETGALYRNFTLRGDGSRAQELVTFGGLTAPEIGNSGVQLGARFLTETGDFGESRGLVAARAHLPTPFPNTQLSLEFGPEWVSNDAGSGSEAYYEAKLAYEPNGRVVDRLAVGLGRERHAPSFTAEAAFNIREAWGPLYDINARVNVERFERDAGAEYRQLSLGFEAQVGPRGPEVYLGMNAPREAGQDGHQLVPVAGFRVRF